MGSGSKEKLGGLFHEEVCPECDGVRLRKESIAVTVGGINIIELSKKSLDDVLDWIQKLYENIPAAYFPAVPDTFWKISKSKVRAIYNNTFFPLTCFVSVFTTFSPPQPPALLMTSFILELFP